MGLSERLEVEHRIKAMLARASSDLGELRQLYDDLCDLAPVPTGVSVKASTLGSVPIEILSPKSVMGDGVILYLHGGGHMVGSLRSHRGLASRLALAARLKVVVVDFRLAPEHTYPVALDDVLAAYQGLLDQGLPANKIALAGDSAGGGLCLSLMLRARDQGLPLPACAALFSPFVDLTGSAPSIAENSEGDILVSAESVHGTRAVYLPEGDATHPYVSPLFGDLKGLPPLMMHVGGTERLLDDSLRLGRRAAMAQVMVDCKIWPNMPHVWQIFAPILSEGQASLDEAGAWLAKQLV